MTKLRAFILSLTLAAAFSLAHGQETSISTREEALFAKAFELYQKGLYASSQKTFQKFLSEYSSDVVAQLRTDAEFYSAICAIELNNNDAEYLLGRFIQNHPESQYIDLAYFVMGKRQYQQKNFTSSIYWLSMIDGEGLDREKRYEMQFMLGYCYFMTNDFELANKWLYQVKDMDSKFSGPATYYYSHIAYLQKKYATALKGFEKLQNDETFAPIVPFYISQIYYLQGDYQKVVAYAPPLVADNATRRTPEIARIVGDSYFKLRQYDSALVYLNKYVEKTP